MLNYCWLVDLRLAAGEAHVSSLSSTLRPLTATTAMASLLCKIKIVGFINIFYHNNAFCDWPVVSACTQMCAFFAAFAPMFALCSIRFAAKVVVSLELWKFDFHGHTSK